jgi:glutamate-1-semialdehyde 2,1-aminomutase
LGFPAKTAIAQAISAEASGKSADVGEERSMDLQITSKRLDDIVAQAKRVLPGGSFGNIAAEVVIREGKGGRVIDEAGREYVDFLLGSGPMFLGHAHPEVNAAVEAQLPLGTTYFANNRHGIALAQAICDAMPCAEQVRFVCTGTEADLYAMRAARAFRKRDKILKFEGGYHGMSDYALMSLAPKQPGNFPRPIPDSAGIPKSVQDEMLIAAFNDIEMVESIIKENKDELAGVIVEPFQRLIAPQPGFLKELRRITAEHGIPLIFDEVVTGFRFAYGGAQEYYGVTPDLCTLGKIIGGGYALAAIAGKTEIMRHFDKLAVEDEDFLFQTGTLSGNPVAAVAGLATLEVLKRPGTYEKVFATGRTLMTTLADLLAQAGIPAQVIGEPPLFDVVFTADPIRNYRDTLKGDKALASRFNQLLRQKGILKGEAKYYVSLAHTEADIDWTISAWTDAIAALKA